MKALIQLLIIIASMFISASSGLHQSYAESGRWETTLSGEGWKLWLDHEADWKNDDIHLPPVDIKSLTVHPPTCGWEHLEVKYDKIVSVPSTVEEHFWSANENPNGIAGDYRGVSWWSTTFTLDSSLKGKRITLEFDSVNLRAEIFVNKQLVGYDIIGNTPFELEITNTATFETENRLDVRITDPVGNFNWNDEYLMRWGDNLVPAVHGFGGITGRVLLRATDAVHIDDIYIQNKPSLKDADVYIRIMNSASPTEHGRVSLVIHEWKHPERILWQKSQSIDLKKGTQDTVFHVKAPRAKLWNIGDPNLYEAVVTYESDDGTVSDAMTRRFGFRFFDIGEKNGDKRFYLNGKRVFILAAMTRGFWPKNGMFPTPEMARKDMETAQELGYNMMLYHRAIGQPVSMAIADEMGMLAYEEPGGYLSNPGSHTTPKQRMAQVPEAARKWRKEKLKRMIIRDRSMPSMVIFNVDDLSWNIPNEDDIGNIKMVHSLDPSRTVTYNCIIKPVIPNERDNPYKLHMKPFDDTLYYHGWQAPYHFSEHAVYVDENYTNPRNYLRYLLEPIRGLGDSLHPIEADEIIFYGEEGGFGTPLRLSKIREELMRTGATGWRETEHLDWYTSYERFLDDSGLTSSFPTVDEFTMALGVNLHYFHGRIIENVRISNKADAYVLNGWASGSTHTDIVDTYRNPTADPSILKHYTQPLYIAVKLRDKVLSTGAKPVADIYIVNEENLKGIHTLTLKLKSPSLDLVHSSDFKVNIKGGEEFGQLLIEEFVMPEVTQHGYFVLNAELRTSKGTIVARGFDDIYVADYLNGKGIEGAVAVVDTTGIVDNFLKTVRNVKVTAFDPYGPDPDFIILGRHNPAELMSKWKKHVRGPDPLMTRVANGTKLIILDRADYWAERRKNIHGYPALKYYGSYHTSDTGRLFVSNDKVLNSLPQSQAMNWEYQTFYRGDVWGLHLGATGVQTIVGLALQNNDMILNSLCRVPFGEGEIIFSTLNIIEALGSDRPQSSIAKKLFLNLLEY